jgi:hypothetical protein
MRTLSLFSLMIVVALAYGPVAQPPVAAPATYQAPAPATCKLNPRNADECLRESSQDQVCGSCVTTNCASCRPVYVDLCSKPRRFADVETCLKLAETAANKEKTRNAILPLCKQQVCAEEAPAPATCKLNPRNADECLRESSQDQVCGSCVTTNCASCRPVYVDLCSKPRRFADVETCLKLAETAANKEKTRNAILPLCKQQVCAEEAPAPATCKLNPRNADECLRESNEDQVCGSCVTTNCASCRPVYVELCSKPRRFADVETCLKLAETAANKEKTRNAILPLCKQQVCAEVKVPKVPKVPKGEARKMVSRVCFAY